MSFLGPLQPWEAAEDSQGSFPFSELDWVGVGSPAQPQLRSTSSTDSMQTLYLSPTVVKLRAATAGPSALRRDDGDPSQGVSARGGNRLQNLKSRQQVQYLLSGSLQTCRCSFHKPPCECNHLYSRSSGGPGVHRRPQLRGGQGA